MTLNSSQPAGDTSLVQHQDTGRPCSPLTGISRLLQQQPHMRPPTSAAGTLRQHSSGKVLVGCVFTAWGHLVKQRREAVQVQSLLAWHHIQHVQAGVWNKWRVAFENKNPYHKLMRVVYQGRRHSTMRRVSSGLTVSVAALHCCHAGGGCTCHQKRSSSKSSC